MTKKVRAEVVRDANVRLLKGELSLVRGTVLEIDEHEGEITIKIPGMIEQRLSRNDVRIEFLEEGQTD